MADPTITSMAKGKNSQPMLISTSLNTGTASCAESASGWIKTQAAAAMAAIKKPINSRTRPDRPALELRLTLAQSSAKPISPKATVVKSTIQT